jgi:hypothetical protein
MKRLAYISVLMIVALMACNTEKVFPDYKTQNVYFAYQYPVRTITLGDDAYVNTDLDNAKKCQIYATLGGVYESRSDVEVQIAVDKSLLKNGMLFGAGKDEILAMPDTYFSLASNKIIIPKGSLAGGVDVQLTDAFFADPKSIKNTYVIPLAISQGDASQLPALNGKNYVLYAIKYINPWHGNYLRRGKDEISGNTTRTVVRHAQYVENDEVNKLTTRSLSEIEFPVVFKDKENNNVNVKMLLRFGNDGKCTIASASENYSATGTGSFIKKGEKNSWGNKDRDALYLKYEVNVAGLKITSTDTLVMRDRSVQFETFSPVSK